MYRFGISGKLVIDFNKKAPNAAKKIYSNVNVADKLKSSCGWMLIRYDDGTFRVASAFCVSPKHVLTAFHNSVHSEKGSKPETFWYCQSTRVVSLEGKKTFINREFNILYSNFEKFGRI